MNKEYYKKTLKEHTGNTHFYYKQCRRNLFSNMIVFRLESEDGYGPFRSSLSDFKADGPAILKPSKLMHMRPDEDFHFISLMGMGFYDPNLNKNLRFGCISINQLNKWMSFEALAKFKQRGYKIVRYNAKNVLVSDNQCIFNIIQATKI